MLSNVPSASGSIKNIIGTSARMNAIFQMIETVAEVQSTVLVTGESGTGKELVARAIHDLSPRAEKPLHLDQLRCFYGNLARIGAVRLRKRFIHRCKYQPQKAFSRLRAAARSFLTR